MVIFVVIYVLLSTDFFICIYLYVYVHGILPVDTYISHPYFYMYMCSYIDTYICFFKALHTDRSCVRHDRQQNAAMVEHLFTLMHSKFSIRLKTLVG